MIASFPSYLALIVIACGRPPLPPFDHVAELEEKLAGAMCGPTAPGERPLVRVVEGLPADWRRTAVLPMRFGEPLRLEDGAELLLDSVMYTHESGSNNSTFVSLRVSRDGKSAHWPAGHPMNEGLSHGCYVYVLGLWIAVLYADPYSFSGQGPAAYVSVRAATPEDVLAHAPPCPCVAEPQRIAPEADRAVAPPWRTAPPSPAEIRRRAQIREVLQWAVARRQEALRACKKPRGAHIQLRLAFVDGDFVVPDDCDNPAQRAYDACVYEALVGEAAPPTAGRHLVCYGGAEFVR